MHLRNTADTFPIGSEVNDFKKNGAQHLASCHGD